ncbi:hypothetical protein SF1_35500 [Sphingobacterium faecium NBRC 15299]|uniref:hypothetical protein n=1 Tax=Sphingobacterium faecium TaxID=34087 RepID=UPI000D37199F|nr:hypothetical protein [Sphingobacterium faecium]PTX08199.1 hypothetical protein C8N37_10914 [Sphingobacterium faecium]GEM65568.1 hypothetical protein SF1_35500 [Sphingobacterium faecium NBRC 15299]
MKRILLALLIGGATLTSLSSCTKEYITNENFLPGISYTAAVPTADWDLIAGTNTYVVELDFPELDKKYFDHGTVTIAMKTKSNPTQYEIIPATIDNYNYSANYSIGKIKIYAKEVGSSTIIKSPEDMTVKITLTDADNGGN